MIVTKYFTHLNNNKEGNERLNKNMKSCVYFRKNSYYDANFATANFVLKYKIRIRICLMYENANIRKSLLRIQNAKFPHTCLFRRNIEIFIRRVQTALGRVHTMHFLAVVKCFCVFMFY
jgi:hypothetical protein